MSRVIVIGAGVGGLAVAARLAAAGHRVTLCERAGVIGGKLGLLERTTPAGEFRFDTGPSLLTLPHVFEDLFRDTGAPLESVLDLRRLDPIARYHYPDGTTFDSCADPAEFRARLDDALGGDAGIQWSEFFRRAGRIWDATHQPFLESTLDGPATLASLAVRGRDLATIAPWRTLRGLAKAYLHDQRLRWFAERYATYTGSDPRRAPAALAAVPYAELAFGGWYVDGGLYRLAEALGQRCADLGVSVRTGTEVRKVIADSSRVRGVLLADGDRLDADLVVADVDAAHLYDELIRVPSAARRLRRATPSLSGFVLMLGLRGRTPDLAHHTVLFPDDYDAEFDAVFGRRGLAAGSGRLARPVDDPTLYVSAPDDPAARPAGHEAWFVLVNAARHGTGAGALDWREPGLAGFYTDHLISRLAARGLDIRDRILFAEARTPADLAEATNSVGGAIYGTSSNGPRAAFLRPANRSPVPGLFLVGGSSHPGGGLPLVALSAQIVAGLIGPA